MEYVIFAVAGEGHFTNIGEEYGRAIKIPANDEINAFLDSVVGAKKLTDEEYYEMFPDERPVPEEVSEDATDVVGDSEPLPEEIPETIS